jgi:hypothetical protein
MAAERKNLVGMAGIVDDPDTLIHVARRVRDAGWRKWDCHTPYPVHGLDAAMGLPASPVAYLCLGAGFVGAGVALLLQWWTSVVDYPVRIGGKPLFSWPAFIPITFELFVLFAALATMGSILVFCKLGRWHSPLHDSGIMAEVTSHRFAVVLEAKDGLFTETSARRLLEESGCKDIRPVHEIEETDEAFL